MPYMFGWHPGFAYPDSVSVLEDLVFNFGDCKNLRLLQIVEEFKVAPIGDVETPNGIYPQKTDYLYKNDTIILENHKNALSVTTKAGDYRFDFSFSENLPSLCIWKEPNDDARYICIEPWSSLPLVGENFDTREMRRLASGESDTFSYLLSFTV